MSKKYYLPGVKAEEVSQADEVIRQTSTSVALMQGVARKGPVNKAWGPFYSLPQWEKVYGGPMIDYKTWYNVRGFFNNKGSELYFNRIAHYTDITSPATRTGTVASRTLVTAEGAESAGYYDATLTVAPYNLEPAQTLIVAVDGDPADTATFDAVAATRDDTTTYPVTAGTATLKLKIDRGEEQTITFVGTETTCDNIVATINDQLLGGRAENNGGQTRIISDTRGTGSYVQITELPTANPLLVFVLTEAQGTGDVADINAVTYAEAKAVLEADLTGGLGVTVSQVGAGYLRITSNDPGATSEIDVQSGTAMAALGFTAGSGSGSATATENTLKIEFGFYGYDSPGTEPNDHLSTKVYKDPRHVTGGLGNDLVANLSATDTEAQLTNLDGLEVGSIIKIWDASNSEYRTLTKVETTIVSGVLYHKVYWTTGLTNAYLAASSQVESREFTIEVYWDNTEVETWDFLTMYDTDADYCETRINDDVTGSEYIRVIDLDSTIGLGADIPADDTAATAMTVSGTSELVGLTATDYMGDETNQLGIYAAEEIASEINQVAYPGYHNATALIHLSQWCENHTFIYPTFAVPLDYRPDQAVTWRKDTFGLYSKFGSLEFCGLKVYDPLSNAADPKTTITPEGHIMGLRSRVDAIPGENDGGVWSAAAGDSEFGEILDALDVEYPITDNDQRSCNRNSINCIRKFNGKIVRFGARTLDSNIKWRYENVVRFFMFIEKSIVEGTRWAVFRNNNSRLWRKLESRVDDFMEDLQDEFAFPGDTKAENWFVNIGIDKGVMTQGDVDNGIVIGNVGVAVNKPAEFIVFRFMQFKGGSFTVEEA